MAELVHKNLESMLPELEELERSGIFSHEEIRQIVRRRRNLEYRLKSRPTKKGDFLRAIQYEVNLDLLRRHRKKKLGLVSTRRDAEYGIQNRIHTLFRRALNKFSSDLKLWLQYIDFSKRCHNRISLSGTFGRVLAIHPHNPGLWVMAAKFEFEDQKKMSSARALLQQGLRANPESKHLWIEYFRMELLHTDKIRKRRAVLGLEAEEDEKAANVTDDFLGYKTASIVYKQAVKAVSDDIEFRLSFIPIYQLFDDTEVRQEEVYESVRGDFPSHPLCWDALARRQWVAMDTATLTESQIVELERGTEQTFSEGLDATGNASSLWEKYIEWCVERTRDPQTSESLQTKAVQRLLDVFKQAHESGHLSEAMMEQYVLTLQSLGLNQDALAVAMAATDVHTLSVPLWLMRLRLHSCCGDSASSLNDLCKEALLKIPKESSLPVWQYWIEESVTDEGTSQGEVESIFQAGLQNGVGNIRETLCADYVDWALLVGGVKKARKVYQSLLAVFPVPYSLYQKCFAVEKSTEKPSMKRLRELFERAVRDCGTEYPGLWLDFIQSELSYQGGDLQNVGKLHWRAVKMLKPEFTADFISQYTILQTAH